VVEATRTEVVECTKEMNDRATIIDTAVNQLSIYDKCGGLVLCLSIHKYSFFVCRDRLYESKTKIWEARGMSLGIFNLSGRVN